MTDRPTSVVISGVGGQGVILAARVLAAAANHSGLEVKASEVHGMAQRGGSVVAQVRFGSRVYSPLIPSQGADYLLALEEMEAFRYLGLLKKKGWVLIYPHRVFPSSVISGQTIYPDHVEDELVREGFRVVNAGRFTELLDCSLRQANIALLGILSRKLVFKMSVWRKAIADSVPSASLKGNWDLFSAFRSKS